MTYTYTYTSDDLFELLQNLLPEGPAWPRIPESTQTVFLKALADSESITAGRMAYLLTDAFPATSVELLPEWEASLGLPDPCWGPAPTLSQRQASVVTRLTATGGQSIPYLEALCASLGFPGTTFVEYTAYRFGMVMGLPMQDEAWNYALGAVGIDLAIHYFLLSHDTTGTPFRWWDNNALICELRRVAPAHIYVTFAFV